MRVHDVDQGTREWSRVRLGIPTSSRFNDLLTPKTLKPAKGDAYLYELLAAWALGATISDGGSKWMERGTELEAEARRAYQWETGSTVTEVGFVTEDRKSVV